MTAPQLAVAYASDLLLGDPEWFPHPVRGFGLLARSGEKALRPFTSGPRSELLAGAALLCFLTAFFFKLTGADPRFPFWGMLLVSLALAFALGLLIVVKLATDSVCRTVEEVDG